MKTGFAEDIRFGIKEERQLNSPVKTYKLSLDEHAKYMDRNTAALIKVREMAREGLKPPKEISKETGVDIEKVRKICHYERYVKGRPKKKGWQ